MARFYGGWVGGDDWYAALDATVENTSSTICTVRLVGWIYNVYAVASNFGAYITTDKNGGTTYYAVGSISEGSGWKRINSSDITFTVDRGTSDKTVSVQCIIYGSGIYSGSSSNAAGNVTIPKIPTEKPNAPSGASATYVSDSSITVAWTNGATSTTKPRTATLVERSTDGGSWVQIASASSSATSYADNGVSANRSYAYRVCASNSAGKSGYSTTGTVYTTPAAPSGIVLSKTAQTTVQVDVEGAAPYATAYRVELTHDGGSTWEVVEASTSLPITVDVGGGTAQFRVASLNGTLQSAWTFSESIVTICPPLAPTIVQQPSNPTARGSSVTIAWTPNHPDGTAQTAAQVKVTNPSGTATTYDLTTATSYTFTPNANGTWTAQVRTKGLDADWGEWSSTVSWGVYALPIVTIASPAVDGGELHAMPLTVSWSVTDPTGVSAQRVVVADADGTQIYNRTQGASVRSVNLTDSDISLQNGGEYFIAVRVMGGSGLIAEAVRTFTVSWTAPSAPVLQIAEGAGASAQIVVDNPTTSASGTVVEAESSILATLTIHGKSVQDGTPSPSNPVAIQSVEGRNLLKPTVQTSRTVEGITYTVEDGTIAVSGTSTAAKDFTIYYQNELQQYGFGAGDYTISGCPAVDGLRLTMCYTNSAGSTVYANDTGLSQKVMLGTPQAIYTNVANGKTFDNAVFKPMFEHGIFPHAYQPYQNIGVTVTGTNLLDTSIVPSSYAQVSYTNGSDGSIVLNGTKYGGGYYVVKTGLGLPLEGTYTLHATQISGTATNRPTIYLIDSDGNVLASVTPTSGNIGKVTFTTDAVMAERIRFGLSTDNAVYTNAAYRIWLTAGSELTEYKQFVGSTVFIDLDGNAIRSLPDGTEDTLEVDGEGNVTLTKRIGLTTTATTDGITATVGTDAMSTTGTLADGATVIYKLASEQTIQLGRIEMPYIDGIMHIDAAVAPTIDASFRPAESADTPPTESVTVQRVNADGTIWTVASSLPLGGTCIDPLPPLGVEVVYIATASAASGATASERYTATIGGRTWALNAGAAAQEHMELRYNPQASYAMEHGGESYHFADGGAGGGRPVFYPTTDRDESGTLKFDTVDKDDTDALRAMSDRNPVMWLRDPFGHRWRAHVRPSSSHGVGRIWQVSIAWDAVRMKEAW